MTANEAGRESLRDWILDALRDAPMLPQELARASIEAGHDEPEHRAEVLNLLKADLLHWGEDRRLRLA